MTIVRLRLRSSAAEQSAIYFDAESFFYESSSYEPADGEHLVVKMVKKKPVWGEDCCLARGRFAEDKHLTPGVWVEIRNITKRQADALMRATKGDGFEILPPSSTETLIQTLPSDEPVIVKIKIPESAAKMGMLFADNRCIYGDSADGALEPNERLFVKMYRRKPLLGDHVTLRGKRFEEGKYLTPGATLIISQVTAWQARKWYECVGPDFRRHMEVEQVCGAGMTDEPAATREPSAAPKAAKAAKEAKPAKTAKLKSHEPQTFQMEDGTAIGWRGLPTLINAPGDGTEGTSRWQGFYAVVPLAALRASHDKDGARKLGLPDEMREPGYTRAQVKVGAFQPNAYFNDDLTTQTGPVVVDRKWRVISGTGRLLALEKYLSGGVAAEVEYAETFARELKRHEAAWGLGWLASETLDRMVLVRVLQDEFNPARITHQLNEGWTSSTDVPGDSVACPPDAGPPPEAFLRLMAERVVNRKCASVTEVMAGCSRVVRTLEESGWITPVNRSRWVRMSAEGTSELTVGAIDALRRCMLGELTGGDRALLLRLPPALIIRLEPLSPALLMAFKANPKVREAFLKALQRESKDDDTGKGLVGRFQEWLHHLAHTATDVSALPRGQVWAFMRRLEAGDDPMSAMSVLFVPSVSADEMYVAPLREDVQSARKAEPAPKPTDSAPEDEDEPVDEDEYAAQDEGEEEYEDDSVYDVVITLNADFEYPALYHDADGLYGNELEVDDEFIAGYDAQSGRMVAAQGVSIQNNVRPNSDGNLREGLVIVMHSVNGETAQQIKDSEIDNISVKLEPPTPVPSKPVPAPAPAPAPAPTRARPPAENIKPINKPQSSDVVALSNTIIAAASATSSYITNGKPVRAVYYTIRPQDRWHCELYYDLRTGHRDADPIKAIERCDDQNLNVDDWDVFLFCRGARANLRDGVRVIRGSLDVRNGKLYDGSVGAILYVPDVPEAIADNMIARGVVKAAPPPSSGAEIDHRAPAYTPPVEAAPPAPVAPPVAAPAPAPAPQVDMEQAKLLMGALGAEINKTKDDMMSQIYSMMGKTPPPPAAPVVAAVPAPAAPTPPPPMPPPPAPAAAPAQLTAEQKEAAVLNAASDAIKAVLAAELAKDD